MVVPRFKGRLLDLDDAPFGGQFHHLAIFHGQIKFGLSSKFGFRLQSQTTLRFAVISS